MDKKFDFKIGQVYKTRNGQTATITRLTFDSPFYKGGSDKFMYGDSGCIFRHRKDDFDLVELLPNGLEGMTDIHLPSKIPEGAILGDVAKWGRNFDSDTPSDLDITPVETESGKYEYRQV